MPVGGKTNRAARWGGFPIEGGTVKNIKWYLVRRWLYWVLVAVGALAIQQGWIDPETVPLILAVALAALNTRPPAVPGEVEGA